MRSTASARVLEAITTSPLGYGLIPKELIDHVEALEQGLGKIADDNCQAWERGHGVCRDNYESADDYCYPCLAGQILALALLTGKESA